MTIFDLAWPLDQLPSWIGISLVILVLALLYTLPWRALGVAVADALSWKLESWRENRRRRT